MTHLSSPQSVAMMVFYSALTFFIMPYITRPFAKKMKDPCLVGFVVGFLISIALWHFVGRYYVMKIR